MEDGKPKDSPEDEMDLLLFGDERPDSVAQPPFEELHLERFLEDANQLRRSTEMVLEELADLPIPQRKLESDRIEEALGLLKESLSQFSHVHSTKLDALRNDFSEAVDVIDGRIALATRVLSERQDGCTVSLTQFEGELTKLQDNIAQIRAEVAVLASAEEPDLSDVQLLEQQQRLMARLDTLAQEFAEMLEVSSEGLIRRQQDLDGRLARLEAAISRSMRKPPPQRSEHAASWLIAFLLLVNGSMVLWLRFLQ